MDKNRVNFRFKLFEQRAFEEEILGVDLAALKRSLSQTLSKIKNFEQNFEYEVDTKEKDIHEILEIFIQDSRKKYFLTNQQQLQLQKICFKATVVNEGNKLLKFQKGLLEFISDFLENLNILNIHSINTYKNEVISILQLLQQFISSYNKTSQTINDVSIKIEDIHSKLKQHKTFYENKSKAHSFIYSFLLKFLKLTMIFLRRTQSCISLIQQYSTVCSVNQSEQEKLQSISQFTLKKSKWALADILQQVVQKYQTQPEMCLTCQTKVFPQQMKKHLKYCQAKTDANEYISQLDGQIIAKHLDLYSHVVQVRAIDNQKPKQQGSKFYLKGKKGFQSGQMGLKAQVDSNCSSTSQTKGPPRLLKQLDKDQFYTYMNLVQQLILIGNKIKKQKYSTSINLLTDLNNLKNILIPKFKKLNVKAPIVDSFVQIILVRRKYMKKLQKLIMNAKSQGIVFSDEIDFQNNQYQDLINNASQEKSNKLEKDNLQKHFSQCQGLSSMKQTDKNYVCLNDFIQLKFLGAGRYGQISLVRKKQTGVIYAMKRQQIHHQKKVENIKNQCRTLSVVKSPFIIKAIFSFTQQNYHYFVMEYMPNGDFFMLLTMESRLLQSQAKLYLAQIAMAINDLHQEGIVHRDIKPQNILIDTTGHIKLSDFGLSEAGLINKKKIEQQKKMSSKFILEQIMSKSKQSSQNLRSNKIVGSPYFMSPQVLSGQPALKMSDWWSYGILVFQTLLGGPPFVGHNLDQIAQKVFERQIWPKDVKFGGQETKTISYEAKDFIQRLLTLNPKQRLGNKFQQIKIHPFFVGIDWNNLLQMTPAFQFQNTNEKFLQGKQISDQTSYIGATNPDLKLIRRDVLNSQTREYHEKQAQKLPNSDNQVILMKYYEKKNGVVTNYKQNKLK